MYLAHKNDIAVQELEAHLKNVAELAAGFAKPAGIEDTAYLTGYLHDYGKFSNGFQRRINGEEIRVEHAFQGAVKAYRDYSAIGKLMAYCIAGHHGGLPNGIDSSESCLTERLKKDIGQLPELNFNKHTPKPPAIKHPEGFTVMVFVRMLFSCIVDADYLDTEKFMDEDRHSLRTSRESLTHLKTALDKYIEAKIQTSESTLINSLRTEIYNTCVTKSSQSQGFFSLSVPTGGGKTLSSAAFAVNHAIAHGKKRIIYVIPYTSIIEQTAETFREIFGKESVLEHHSNFDGKTVYGEDDDRFAYRMKLASENWDAPIVVTTSVQFFESFFSNKPSRCRKLHNCADSVIIFDEAQMLPYDLFLPCIKLLKCLVDDYGVSAVLCTATQPVLGSDYLKNNRVENIRELIDNQEYYHKQFKRTQITHIGSITDSELSALIEKEKSSLTIVNTKQHAHKLYTLLNGRKNLYHLSTLMCPVHRRITLDKIREHLTNGENCTVISTQLIEAGVDVDFPAVFRSEAGIDSIAQSAGRCNRNGKLDTGSVYVFSSKGSQTPRIFRQYVQTAEEVIRHYPDILSKEAVSAYFERLYKDKGAAQLDRHNILTPDYINLRTFDFPFRDIAERFRLIESSTQSVIVPFDDEAEELINALRYSEITGSILKKLQKYTVQLFQHEYERIETKLTKIKDTFAIVNKDAYDYEGTGILIFEDHYKTEDFIL
jgi:CRISPR-associated endonuclease/helicase Cas3/CRISPR-associated endonuclease Cas3-HD